MTLYELAKLEGKEAIAARAGIPQREVQLLRSATLPDTFFVATDILCHLWSEFDIDGVPVLQAVVDRTGEIHIERLLAIARAWPQLDLEKTILDIHDRKATRDAKRAAGIPENRGRKPKDAADVQNA